MDEAVDSISEWFARLKAGEAEAAQKLWNRYSGKLQRIAKQRMNGWPRRIADEEDVALSAFGSIYRGAVNGRFEQISTRDELWWLLLSITKRKAVDHVRREVAQRRHARRDQTERQRMTGVAASWSFSLNDLVSSSPTPDFLVALEEQYGRLLGMLRNDQLRRIAVLRIEGYTVAEIAPRMKVGQRAIERKLQLIRGKWKRELFEPDHER
jgi:DNA-directed RNA polymerase specialized sigma24 family protein